jgi:pyruvate carboxylase
LTIYRGEIAVRILSSARELDIETYTLYSPGDTSHRLHSTHSISIPSASTYLDIPSLIALVKSNNIDAIHPGYGFLTESAEFAQRLWTEANAVVIGPGWVTLARTGDKLAARQLAEESAVPVLPGVHTPTNNIEDIRRFATQVGFPIIIKAVDGGGGRGIRIVREEADLAGLMERALRESPQGQVFAEKAAIDGFRHVEVQIVGDGHGNVRHLWERECSVQRRFQKVVEFAPSSIKNRELVGRVIEAAIRMAKRVDYLSLGTFEFLVHSAKPEFYFLEVNPRLQVEHTITESLCPGLDLVKVQLQVAMGQSLANLLSHTPQDPRIPPPLNSIQLRITSEDASANWSLSVGKISSFTLPAGNGVRADTHVLPGLVVKTDFDSLLAKIIVTTSSWEDMIAKAKRALEDTSIEGVTTSLVALRGIIFHPDFMAQNCDTQWLEKTLPQVLEAGKTLTAALPKSAASSTSSSAVGFSAASSGVPFRKGDAWSISLSPEGAEGQTLPSHLHLTKVLRNEFPTSLSATILYTPPSGTPQPYTIALTSTTVSAELLTSASNHRRGDPSNPNHVIIPFPGQLVDIMVDVGDVIAKNDIVAVVKQMKMELEIRASRAGVVSWVYEGDEGDEVSDGVLMVEVVEEEGANRAKL